MAAPLTDFLNSIQPGSPNATTIASAGIASYEQQLAAENPNARVLATLEGVGFGLALSLEFAFPKSVVGGLASGYIGVFGAIAKLALDEINHASPKTILDDENEALYSVGQFALGVTALAAGAELAPLILGISVTLEVLHLGAEIATAWGDVHLTTFDGLLYNFQAAGEFVLAKARRQATAIKCKPAYSPMERARRSRS